MRSPLEELPQNLSLAVWSCAHGISLVFLLWSVEGHGDFCLVQFIELLRERIKWDYGGNL